MSDPGDPSNLAYEHPDDQRPASAAVPPPQILDEHPAAPHDPYAALRFRDFRLYLVGWIVSVIGSQILEVAVAWDLYQRTKNALSLAWVGLVSAAPIILLALPAGQIADRFDRRRIMVTTQILTTSCAVALGVLSLRPGPLLAIYSILFMSAVGKAVGWPARSASSRRWSRPTSSPTRSPGTRPPSNPPPWLDPRSAES